jgi:hypothetical protein
MSLGIFGSGLGNLKMTEQTCLRNRSDHSSIVNNELVEKINNKIQEIQQFTISKLSMCFP